MELFKNKIKMNFNSLKNSEVSYFFSPFPWIRVNYKYLFDQQLFLKYRYHNIDNNSKEILFLDPNCMCRVYKSRVRSSQKNIIQNEITLKTHISLNEMDHLPDISDFIYSKEVNKNTEQKNELESLVKKSINNNHKAHPSDEKKLTETIQKLDDILEIYQKISIKY